MARIGRRAPCEADAPLRTLSHLDHRLCLARRGEPETVGLDCPCGWVCRRGETSGKLGAVRVRRRGEQAVIYEDGARRTAGSKASLETGDVDTPVVVILVDNFSKGSASACLRSPR